MYRPFSANNLRLLSLVCCAWMLSASNQSSQAQQRWPAWLFGQPSTTLAPADDVPRNDAGGGGVGGIPMSPDDPLAADPVIDDPLADDPLAADPVIDDPLVDDPVIDDPVVDDATPWEQFFSEPFPLLRFLILFLTQLLDAFEEIAGGGDGSNGGGIDAPAINAPPAGTPVNAFGR